MHKCPDLDGCCRKMRPMLSFAQYRQLAKQFRIRLRRRWIPPFPPVYFGEVRGKDDGELVCYLFLDHAREEWVALQDPDGELEELFA
jgi:hypothetical protein